MNIKFVAIHYQSDKGQKRFTTYPTFISMLFVFLIHGGLNSMLLLCQYSFYFFIFSLKINIFENSQSDPNLNSPIYLLYGLTFVIKTEKKIMKILTLWMETYCQHHRFRFIGYFPTKIGFMKFECIVCKKKITNLLVRQNNSNCFHHPLCNMQWPCQLFVSKTVSSCQYFLQNRKGLILFLLIHFNSLSFRFDSDLRYILGWVVVILYKRKLQYK
jgi:hypothetical protein